jgi:hypothetical protein
MAHKRVSLRRDGGAPTVELQFGRQLFAKYDIYLYDRNGRNPAPIAAHETNDDDRSETYSVGGSVEDLNQRILFWQAVISVLDDNPDQTYLMRAVISQGGAVVGTFERAGAIAKTVIDQDTVRFVLE